MRERFFRLRRGFLLLQPISFELLGLRFKFLGLCFQLLAFGFERPLRFFLFRQLRLALLQFRRLRLQLFFQRLLFGLDLGDSLLILLLRFAGRLLQRGPFLLQPLPLLFRRGETLLYGRTGFVRSRKRHAAFVEEFLQCSQVSAQRELAVFAPGPLYVPAHGQQFTAIVHERRPGLALSRDRRESIQQLPVTLHVGVHGAGALHAAGREQVHLAPGVGLLQSHGDGIALKARNRQQRQTAVFVAVEQRGNQAGARFGILDDVLIAHVDETRVEQEQFFGDQHGLSRPGIRAPFLHDHGKYALGRSDAAHQGESAHHGATGQRQNHMRRRNSFHIGTHLFGNYLEPT